MESKVVIESREIRMSHGNFVSQLVFRYAGWWLLALSAVAVTGVVFGITVDLRWFVAGMMVVFIIIPMVLAFLYYYYALRKEFYVNMTPHRLLVGENGISAILRIAGQEDPDESGSEVTELEVFFSYSVMKSCIASDNSFVITFRKQCKGFLWFPSDAFGEIDSSGRAIEMICSGIYRYSPHPGQSDDSERSLS